MRDYKNTCPLCGDTLIYDGGYIQCQDPACGWNKPMYLEIFRSNTNKDVKRGKVNRRYSPVSKERVPKIASIRNHKLRLASNS